MRTFCLGILFWACRSEDGVKIYNSEPTATITSHTDGSIFQEGLSYTLIGQVSDGNHTNSELKVRWTSDVRDLCAESTPDATGATTCNVNLDTAETQIKLQVTDPEGAAVLTSISITVQETEPPSIEIISPVSSVQYYSDQLISFSAIINDAEDEPQDLHYQWTSSIDGDLNLNVSPDSDGSITGYAFLSEGQHALSLSVEDTTGKTKTASIPIIVGGANSDPTCSISTPLSGEGFAVGQNISFAGIANDIDINNAFLNITWQSDIDGVFNTSPALTDGTLGFTTDILSIGNHAITLRVEDEVGALCTAGVQLVIGTPPSVILDAPTPNETVALNSSVFFSGSVFDQEDIPTEIALSWISDRDGEFSTQGSDSNGLISFGYSNLSSGTHHITLHATDSDGLRTTLVQNLHVNTPPTQPMVTISPATANTTTDITASYTNSSDANNDPLSYAFQWFQNGVLTGYTSDTIPASATAVEDVWLVQVTPNDGYNNGAYGEASITIENSLPSISSVSISPDPIYADSILTCFAITYDADQTLTPSYTWTIDNVDYQGASLDISTLSISPQTQVTCTASATDDQGASTSLATSLSITNRPPNLSSTTITPNTGVYNDDVVTCSTIASDLEEYVAPTYQWSINGMPLSTESTLDLSTISVYPNDSVLCTVYVADSFGAAATDTASILIENRAPSSAVIEITPTIAYEGDELTCTITTPSIDPDGQTVSYQYEWTQNLSLTTNNTNTVSGSDVFTGDEWECFVTPSDGIDQGPTTSETLSILDGQVNVLVIWDSINSNTQSLVSALEGQGWTVDLSDTTETSYDGTNPSLSTYNVVIHLNGTTYSSEMPISGQQALVDFVQNGGGFIHNEWNAFEIGENRMLAMRDLTLFDRVTGTNGTYTWSIVSSQTSHPVVANLPMSFSISGGMNNGSIHNFSTDPATVLMTSSTGDTVAVREWNGGCIVGFAHAGNWESTSTSFGTLSNSNAQQLYINAVEWCQ